MSYLPDLRSLAALAALAVVCVPAHAQTVAQEENDATIQQATGVMLTVSDPLTRTQAVEEIYGRLWEDDRQALDVATTNVSGNAVLVRQTGAGNDVTSDQFGVGNLAVTVQEGALNASVIEQTGNDNIYGAWVTGDGNDINVSQRGDGNVYLLDFQGDDLSHTVLQEGDNLQLIQLGESEIPFSVEQRGSGASMTISHNGAMVSDLP